MKLAQFFRDQELYLGIVEGEKLLPLAFTGDFHAWLKAGKPLTTAGMTLYLDQVNTWSATITEKVDFEAELAVVIGEKTSSCQPGEALSKVLGYTCGNDVSARDLQFGDKQFVRGKSLDTFCPLGPWLVTTDELKDPQKLAIRSRLNGKIMQESNTANMIFPVAELVSFLSRHFTLEPGDIIMTGTPSGVGVFREPPIFMQDGDLIEVEIAGIGTLKNYCSNKV
jgi:2-keto-4-pentenoate hydratase/2-oxohepta-3-ene-1,7-dioic acid hydratase in catechol pathway